jgi:hypothetical protein
MSPRGKETSAICAAEASEALEFLLSKKRRFNAARGGRGVVDINVGSGRAAPTKFSASKRSRHKNGPICVHLGPIPSRTPKDLLVDTYGRSSAAPDYKLLRRIRIDAGFRDLSKI